MHANPPYYCLSAYGEAYLIPSGRDGGAMHRVRLLGSRCCKHVALENRAATAQIPSPKLPIYRP